MDCTPVIARSHLTLSTWTLREWRRQAAILYPGNLERQHVAILTHIQLAMQFTNSPQRWSWLADLGACVVENGEVAP